MIKWFCALCWRHGALEFTDEDLAAAILAHRDLVALEKVSTPNPTMFPAGHPLMGHYGSLNDCPGDVRIGEAPKKKRYKPSGPLLDFEGEK